MWPPVALLTPRWPSIATLVLVCLSAPSKTYKALIKIPKSTVHMEFFISLCATHTQVIKMVQLGLSNTSCRLTVSQERWHLIRGISRLIVAVALTNHKCPVHLPHGDLNLAGHAGTSRGPGSQICGPLKTWDAVYLAHSSLWTCP